MFRRGWAVGLATSSAWMASELKLILLSFAMGMLLGGALWLISKQPLVGMFGCCVCLCRFLLDNCRLQDEERARREEIRGLNWRIAALRNILRDLTLVIAGLEAEHRMAGNVRPVSVR